MDLTRQKDLHAKHIVEAKNSKKHLVSQERKDNVLIPKHSDLYTDENPKGTIHGLGFKDVKTAKASVSKIKRSGRSHAHKTQAAIAMEQRAREMGKTSEAAVYRRFIEQQKKKDSGEKEMNWKEVLKAHCGTEKQEMEKLVGNQKKIDADKDGKITGKDFAILRDKTQKSADMEKLFGSRKKNQYTYQTPQLTQEQKDMIDAFMTTRGVSQEQARRYLYQNNFKPPQDVKRAMSSYRVIKSEDLKSKILREIEKEGGALGMKNLKQFGEESEIKRVLAEMEKEGKVFMHKDGDIYTHEPKR